MKKLATAKNFYLRNERRILLTAAVASTTLAVVQGRGIKAMNEFLKENDLFDKYYFVEEI